MDIQSFRQLSPKERLQFLATLPLKKKRIAEDLLNKQYTDEHSQYVEIDYPDEDVRDVLEWMLNVKKWLPYRCAKVIKSLPHHKSSITSYFKKT